MNFIYTSNRRQFLNERSKELQPQLEQVGERFERFLGLITCLAPFNGPIKQVLAFLIGVAQMPLFPE